LKTGGKYSKQEIYYKLKKIKSYGTENEQRQSLKQKFLPYLVMKAQVFELPNTELNEFYK